MTINPHPSSVRRLWLRVLFSPPNAFSSSQCPMENPPRVRWSSAINNWTPTFAVGTATVLPSPPSSRSATIDALPRLQSSRSHDPFHATQRDRPSACFLVSSLGNQRGVDFHGTRRLRQIEPHQQPLDRAWGGGLKRFAVHLHIHHHHYRRYHG